MALVQTQLQSFHDKIRFGYDSSKDLRDRRDTLLAELKDKISEDAPSYSTFTQGSYALNTGIHPLGGNPDLDIGILFDCSPDDYPDPLSLKKYVRDALQRHNRTVRIRRPCVTVTYWRDNVPLHHIDLAVYCSALDGQTQIAWCRESTAKSERKWMPSEPKTLTDTINQRFSGAESDQFRRCVRALKRWRDKAVGHKNVPSIALTVAAYKWFEPSFDDLDGRPTDLVALKCFIQQLRFEATVTLPVDPYNDLFSGMTDTQKNDFSDKLSKLYYALVDAELQADTHEACKILNRQFGDDFPVPDTSTTTKHTSPGVSTSGRSA